MSLYTQETISHLTRLIKGDTSSREWLQMHNFPELILLYYSLEGNDQALLEMTKNKYVELVAFVHAVQDDKRAFNWLAENKKYTWAATVRVTYNDKTAEAWLLKNNLHHFAELGIAIRKNEENEAADDIFGLMRKFIQSFRNPAKRKTPLKRK